MFTPFAFIKRQVSAAIATIQKVLIAGNFISFRTISYGNLIKTTPTTAIDTTFNMGSGVNSSINASAIDENGKILIGGAFTSYSGSSQFYITRINTDGTRDATFNIGSGITGTSPNVYTILPVSQSKILVGGNFDSYSGSVVNDLIRINSNGTRDTTFQNPRFNSLVYTVATQSDNKIIVGGAFTNQGYSEPYLAKLNSQLDPNTTFNIGTGANSDVYAFATQSDGKIIIGGDFTTYSGSLANKIERINTDGTIDTSFNQGSGFNNDVTAIKVQSDGKIVVGGAFASYSGSTANRIARLNTNGTLDTTFNTGTGFNSGQVYDLQLQSDGKIIAVGSWSATYSGSSAIRIARINTNGTLDTTFNSGTTGFSATQYSAQIQNDGKIIVVGTNATYSGSAAQRIRRINTNGTLDTTFNIGTAGLNNTTYVAKIQPDQKIIVMGSFTSYSGSSVNRITRINTNGTRDLTFNVGTGLNTATAIPSALELDSSGNIYAGSSFTTYSGSTVNYFVKISPSGSIITGSGLYNGFDNNVNALLVDSTGSIYTGGLFQNYLQPINYIIRLNTDGTKDLSFLSGVGFGFTVISLQVQPDDKIIVGGAFTTYSGSSNNYIVRLNSNGTKDTSFNIGTGFNGNIYKLILQPDDKIIVGGAFTTYSGSSNNGLIRINSNGTKDTTFNIGNGANAFNTLPTSIIQDQSGNIHYGNIDMISYSGSSVRGYVKLTSSGSIDPTFLSTAASASSTPGAYTLGTATTGIFSISIDSSNNAYLFGNFQNYLTPSSSYLSSSRITALDLTSGDKSSPPNFGTGFNNIVTYSSTTPSGDIWLSGDFTIYSGSSINSSDVIKINSQGTLINSGSFPSALSIGTPPTAIFAQSDGKCLVAFINIYGLADMVRLNSNGTLDNTFFSSNYPLGYGYANEIRAIKQQSNGDILFGGNFNGLSDDGEGGYQSEYPFYLTKYNSSGSFLGLNYPVAAGYVNNINLLPDDSFIVTGYNLNTGGGFIQKWDSTGSIDNSYNSGSFNGEVYTSTLQPDQKIIAAGAFTSYSGSAINRIARINTDGTLDTTFNPGSGFDVFSTFTSKIVVDQENNIHVVGPFTTYSGSVINGYVKILPNGNIHPQYTGPISGSAVGVYTPNFINKDAYTMELLNY
jgi:uncharacterized delta-60 repeat protein